jgi:CHAD domain-containing protein/CYTH domain-containing protein
MQLPCAVPSLPVDEGARRLALSHLAAAKAARARLVDGSDSEALHDYRVALRRLRSCLRAYRKYIRSSVTRKSLRRLRRLARRTSQSRDLEVHLAWLDEQLASAQEGDRAGISWMIERLQGTSGRAGDKMLALDERLFPTVHDRLFAQLSRFRTRVRLDTDPRRRSTAVVTARGVRSASSRLKKRLRRVFGYSSEAQIHRARIAAKHLRYLIEPFAGGLSNEDTVIEQLKSLQSAYGDVHDAHVFMAELRGALLEAETTTLSGDRDVVPGLTALIKTLHARGKQAFETVSTSWLWDRSEPFFNQVDAVADTIADLAQADREVERKFLLSGLPPLEDAEGSVEIEQGYLPGERLVERLRRIESPDTVELVRTVKEGSGLTRLEVEEPVTPGVFDQFWPLTEGRRLRKRRYRIPEGDLVWEIDEFLDRDLVLAEVELPGPTSEIAIPGWLRPHVIREVTQDPAYTNAQLASGPSPTEERR